MKTTPRHTPGPWFYDDSMAYRIAINSERASVAVIPYLDREAKANARVIAAAPDLLAVLRIAETLLGSVAYIATQGDTDTVLITIRAAIAKAEGQS